MANSGDARVGDLMTASVETAHIDEGLDRARERMRAGKLDALPVADGDTLVGIVTDGDLARAEAGATLRDITPPKVVHCFVDTPAREARATMRAAGVDHLIVFDDNKELAGIVAAGDLGNDAEGADPAPQASRDRDRWREEHPNLDVYSEGPKLRRP